MGDGFVDNGEPAPSYDIPAGTTAIERALAWGPVLSTQQMGSSGGKRKNSQLSEQEFEPLVTLAY